MGKNLISQAQGKGGPKYRVPSFNYAGEARLPKIFENAVEGTIKDFVKSRGHLSPLMTVEYENGMLALVQAPEGMHVGQKIYAGTKSPIEAGSVIPLEHIPEGTLVFNIETIPGDGGKFCRTPGTFAKVTAKTPKGVVIVLPSKREKTINPGCRAMIGIAAGAGLKEKPFLKAGKMHFHRKARGKRYPMIRAAAQNAVDHPFGNKRTSRKARNKPASKHAPPGRKAGTLWPKRTGKRK